MKRPQFFFDTADVEYVKTSWEQMKDVFMGEEIVGITTNPSALEKICCRDMSSLKVTVNELCKLVTEIRKDNAGTVYVQLPFSKMSTSEALKYAKLVAKFSDGVTEVGLKIPPSFEMLNVVDELNSHLDVNVTGLADCSTALKCLGYNVRYVSIIPGRMEEKGIDAKRQISFIKQRKNTYAEIITGSMRTLEGLKWVIEYDTVPTIGSRVFDQILKGSPDGLKSFKAMWNSVKTESRGDKFSPPITQDMTELSVSFFEQMDECGKHLFNDFTQNAP